MDLTIHNARLGGSDQLVDLGITADKIAVIQAASLPPVNRALDVGGARHSAFFIDPHFHLDNALLTRTVNQSGTLREAIQLHAQIKRPMSHADMLERGGRALSDRIAVICGGQIVGQVEGVSATDEQLGLMMAGEPCAGTLD